MYVLTKFGGGKEHLVLVAVGLIFCTREKFFYFLTLYTIDKACIGLMKLSYHQPRPYMVDPDITPIHCSKEFGNPSGHTTAAFSISIVVFFEVMHGMYHRKKDNGAPDCTFFGWCAWGMLLLVCLFWTTFIPASRWVLGVHGADQILFGSLLGIWNGCTCHFLIRDNLLKWMVRAQSTNEEGDSSSALGMGIKKISRAAALTTSERVVS